MSCSATCDLNWRIIFNLVWDNLVGEADVHVLKLCVQCGENGLRSMPPLKLETEEGVNLIRIISFVIIIVAVNYRRVTLSRDWTGSRSKECRYWFWEVYVVL